MKQMFVEIEELGRCFYCPLCKKYHPCSEYLHKVFAREPKVEFFANLVTHYRHTHIKYYDNGVGYVCRFHDYDAFKIKVNNRAKRQIIRKSKNYLKSVGITPNDICRLQNNDKQTLKLAHKHLSFQPHQGGTRTKHLSSGGEK